MHLAWAALAHDGYWTPVVYWVVAVTSSEVDGDRRLGPPETKQLSVPETVLVVTGGKLFLKKIYLSNTRSVSLNVWNVGLFVRDKSAQ